VSVDYKKTTLFFCLNLPLPRATTSIRAYFNSFFVMVCVCLPCGTSFLQPLEHERADRRASPRFGDRVHRSNTRLAQSDNSTILPYRHLIIFFLAFSCFCRDEIFYVPSSIRCHLGILISVRNSAFETLGIIVRQGCSPAKRKILYFLTVSWQ
jgi:hypothetical protein